MSKERFFYLLKGIDKNGKTVFAQKFQANSFDTEPTLTYRAEYAHRMLNYQEAVKFKNDLIKCKNFVAKIKFTIVKYFNGGRAVIMVASERLCIQGL